MTSISVQAAQDNLFELIHQLKPGDELILTENDQPVAKLVAERQIARKPRRRGSAKGNLEIHSEDDEHLDDFKAYMP